MKLFQCTSILLCSFWLLGVNAAPNITRIIPDPQQYAPFLLKPWQPEKPSIVALKDPFCPYCITALKKRSQLKNYNVFNFWAPILGEQSVVRSKELFTCPSPASPEVIDAVINIRSPRCHGVFKDDLWLLNQRIVDNYQPNSVPQFWMGGREIFLSSLKLERVEIDADSIAYSTSLKVRWPRYQALALNDVFPQRYHIAIMLPEDYPINVDMLKKIKDNQRFNWYLGSNKVVENTLHSEFLCRYNKTACRDKSIEHYRYANEEFRLLNGLKDITQPTFILEGKMLTTRERNYLIPADVRALFNFTSALPPIGQSGIKESF